MAPGSVLRSRNIKTPKARSTSKIIGKLAAIKVKHFCSVTDVKRTRRPCLLSQTGENTGKDTPDEELVCKIHSRFLKIYNEKQATPLKKWAGKQNRLLTKGDTQTADSHIKRCSTPYVIREMQIKMTMRDFYALICCGSVAQSWLMLCDPMDCSAPGLPVRHYLSESTQTHVH